MKILGQDKVSSGSNTGSRSWNGFAFHEVKQFEMARGAPLEGIARIQQSKWVSRSIVVAAGNRYNQLLIRVTN